MGHGAGDGRGGVGGHTSLCPCCSCGGHASLCPCCSCGGHASLCPCCSCGWLAENKLIRRGHGLAVDRLELHASPQVHLGEPGAELLAHDAVEHKVNRVVEQRDEVHEVTQRKVDVVVEGGHGGAEQDENALRELRDDEEDDDHQQHAGRSGLARSLRGLATRRRGQPPPSTPPSEGEGVDERAAEDEDEDARDELGHHGVRDDVDEHDVLGLVGGQLEVLEGVESGVLPLHRLQLVGHVVRDEDDRGENVDQQRQDLRERG